MDNHNLTPEESIDIITKAIINLKTNFKESAKIFLLWGWILALASFSNFIILKILHNQEAYGKMGFYSFVNWAGFMLIGFIILFFMLRKLNKSKKIYSHLDIYINNLWWVAMISFFVAIFLSVKLAIAPPPLMLLIAGLATTTTGLFIKFKPVIFGGVSFFIFSIVTVFVSNEYIALTVCISIICGYIIPGYFLKSAKE